MSIRPYALRLALLLTVACSVLASLAPSGAEAAVTCTNVASTTGSDLARGTEAAPFRTAQKLVSSLSSGETGCLRAGTYSADNQVKVSKAGITLASYPGERATLKTRLWITEGANHVTVQGLVLNGRNTGDLPSPTVNADDAVFRNNEVTNEHTAICFNRGSSTYGRAARTLIESNRIHDCGPLPATNLAHGIYIARADHTVIRDNLIYRNADRGIQLYPDAQHSTITGNVIDGNGEGILFAGESGEASSNNLVENNLITNAKIRHNVESYYPSDNPIGTGNIVRNNCVWGGEQGNIQGPGFTATSNIIANPVYVDRGSGNFSLQAGSPCAGILSGATPGGSTSGGNTSGGNTSGSGKPQRSKVTLSASLTTKSGLILSGKVVRRRFRAHRAVIQRLAADGAWKRVARARIHANRRFRMRASPSSSGQAAYRAKVRHVGRSRVVRVALG
jgi:Right handed beta helix region